MQGKLIAVVYTMRTYWNQLSLGGICKQYYNSVRLVSEEVKSIKFDNFDNSHNNFLRPEYFIDFLMWKMDPMSGGNIRLVFTLPPRDSTLQYKRCVHFWNNFLCITSLNQKIQIVVLDGSHQTKDFAVLNKSSKLPANKSASSLIYFINEISQTCFLIVYKSST